jgi:hypothetical protein
MTSDLHPTNGSGANAFSTCQLQTFVVSLARAPNDSLDLALLALNEVIR